MSCFGNLRSGRWCIYAILVGLILASLLTPIDRCFFTLLLPLSNSSLGTFWAHCADFLGNGMVLLALAVLFCFSASSARNSCRNKCIFQTVSAFVVAGVAGQLLKFIIGRPRPGTGLDSWAVNLFSTRNDFHSFPSGHAAGALVIALVLSHYFPRYRYMFMSFALFISLGRLVGQSHFLTDIAAGFLIALMSADMVIKGALCVRPRVEPRLLTIKTNP